MKAYGHSRRDMLRCPYGCCGGKSVKERSCRKTVDRSNRKTARQQEKKGIFTSLVEGDGIA